MPLPPIPRQAGRASWPVASHRPMLRRSRRPPEAAPESAVEPEPDARVTFTQDFTTKRAGHWQETIPRTPRRPGPGPGGGEWASRPYCLLPNPRPPGAGVPRAGRRTRLPRQPHRESPAAQRGASDRLQPGLGARRVAFRIVLAIDAIAG